VRPAPGRALQYLLVGSFAITAGAVFALWTVARGQVPGYIVWVLAAAMLTLGATGWLFVRRAVEADRAAGARLVPLREQLAMALGKLEELTNSQGRFVGNIAHELKTPLAIVLTQSDLLLGCSNDPTVRHYAKSIGAEMRHLADLVESFLRLARPFAQADTSHHAPVYLHDVVVDAVRRSQSRAREEGVSVVATLAEPGNGDAPVEVLGDSLLLEAMVENLLRNAVRFSPPGSRVEVVVEARGESIGLCVRDQGPGIPAEYLTSVFDWFFDVSPQARRSSGTGFGLAIAKRVAEHHNGSIALRNRAEGGCEFEIQLPRWRATGPGVRRA
jgi:signal transduction histidine kinase